MPRVQSAINGWVRMVCGGFNTWIGAQAIEETGVAILLEVFIYIELALQLMYLYP